MRIAVSADGRSPHTERWVNALAARRHELTVIWHPDHVGAAALARYRPDVHHLVCRPPFMAGAVSSNLIEQVRPAELTARIVPDIIQGMNLIPHGWTAAAVARPLVQFALGSDVGNLGRLPGNSPRRALGNAYRKSRTLRAVRRADMVFCDSSAIAQRVQALAPGVRIEIIRIGVEVSVDGRAGRDWRSELGIANDAFVALSTRLVNPNYNIETIIGAFALLREKIPNSVLILKDFESFGDQDYRERCHRLISELHIEDAVRHVGEIGRPDLRALYPAADVFVSVPTNDATAVSVMEAMAASVPVIASRTQGMDPAVLRHCQSALLVAAEDVHGLADAIMAVYSLPELSAHLREEGLRTVSAVGDLERELDRAERLYDELVARA